VSVVDIDPRRAQSMYRYRNEYQNGNALPLFELLYWARDGYSTDPRDKIYGLLGFACDGKNIDVNYSRPTLDIYRSYTMSAIAESKSLDVLSTVEDHAWTSESNLPSWVTDWSAHIRGFILLTPFSWMRFAASPNTQAELRLSEDKNVLLVEGKRFDTVKAVGRAMSPLLFRRKFVRKSERAQTFASKTLMWKWRQWEALAFSLKSYPTGESPEEAYCRTLTADYQFDPQTAPDGLPRLYRTWRDIWSYGFREKDADQTSREEQEDAMYAALYKRRVAAVCQFRRLIITKKGYIGLGPFSSKPGDRVCILIGGKTPFVLRKAENGHHRLVGDAYVHGLMSGEGMKDESVNVEEIALE